MAIYKVLWPFFTSIFKNAVPKGAAFLILLREMAHQTIIGTILFCLIILIYRK
jgi:hypothetical protein